MIHRQGKNRKRRASPCVEPLDDRVVLSGVSALGTHAVAAAAVHVAVHPDQGAVAQFDATVDRSEKQAVTQFNRASRQIHHVDTMDRGAVGRAAARLNEGTITSARTAALQLTRSTDAIATSFDRFAARSELRWNRTAGALDNRFDRAVQREVRRDPSLESAALADAVSLATTNAELGGRLAGELATARDDLQAAISSAEVRAAGAPARTAAARPAVAAIRHAVHPVQAAHHPMAAARAAITSAATRTAATAPFLGAGVTTATQFGTAGASVIGTGLGLVPSAMGAVATGGIRGGAGNGAFGVGSFGGTGNLIGGTAPSPVTGTTGAGVNTGLDTFGIGTGFGGGTGIDMTPNGDGPFF